MKPPLFEVRVWGGRLPTPIQYRGTVLARQFESGRIGGRRVKESRTFADTPQERRVLQNFVRRHDDVEIVYLSTSRVRPQQKLTRAQVLRPTFLDEKF